MNPPPCWLCGAPDVRSDVERILGGHPCPACELSEAREELAAVKAEIQSHSRAHKAEFNADEDAVICFRRLMATVMTRLENAVARAERAEKERDEAAWLLREPHEECHPSSDRHTDWCKRKTAFLARLTAKV